MGLINYHQKCRVCGHTNLDTIFTLGEHHLHGLFVFKDFQPPTCTVPTELVRCVNSTGGCGLVQLRHSIDPDVLYSRYGYRSSTNATMRAHLTKIALEVDSLWVKHHNIFDHPHQETLKPTCLDIGCNDGFLAQQLPASYSKIGIDPCDIGCKIEGIENFQFINDSYPSGALYGAKFDIITMIACFYDLDNPVNVASKLRNQLNNDGLLVVEVSYWPDKMKQNAIDEVCHEHVCFYNYQNLEDIFNRVGLKIINAVKNTINGGSIQIWLTHENNILYSIPEARKNILSIKFNEMNLRLDTSTPYQDFFVRCAELKDEIKTCINGIVRSRFKNRIHLYGASTKGNVLLQWLGITELSIQYAAERSKEKYGGRTLGSNIKMISEEESRKMKPDYYFVPIWGFKDEIIKREQMFLEGGGKLIFPLPKLEIIEK